MYLSIIDRTMYVDTENQKGWCLVIQCAPYFSCRLSLYIYIYLLSLVYTPTCYRPSATNCNPDTKHMQQQTASANHIGPKTSIRVPSISSSVQSSVVST